MIVLLHDGGSHRNTVDAVPCMLDVAISRGYTIVPAGHLGAYAPSALATPIGWLAAASHSMLLILCAFALAATALPAAPARETLPRTGGCGRT